MFGLPGVLPLGISTGKDGQAVGFVLLRLCVQAAVSGLYWHQPEGCAVTGLQQLAGPVDRKVGVGIIIMCKL